MLQSLKYMVKEKRDFMQKVSENDTLCIIFLLKLYHHAKRKIRPFKDLSFSLGDILQCQVYCSKNLTYGPYEGVIKISLRSLKGYNTLP